MSILGPNGQPVAPDRKLTDQEIIHAMGTHRQQLERLSIGQIQSGLFTEWATNQLIEKLALVQDALAQANITVDLSIDPSGFPAWAEARYAEVQEEEKTRAMGKISLEDK